MNLKEEKWFIRIPDYETSIAVQEWLFKQGVGWSGKPVTRHDFHTWASNAAIGFGHLGGKSLGQASVGYWAKNEHKEIKITLKTVVSIEVDKVEYPEVESPQQIKIRELEETIAKAQEQIQALKKEI